MTTLACTITSGGITAPSYDEILAGLQSAMQAIYGSDIYISPDSQDGQFLALIASAINDQNQAVINAFVSFSPTFAQGAQLSSLVKINGISRDIPSASTAIGNVVGSVGTTIENGVVADVNGNLWNLPASVTIPTGGSIAVTVTAQNPGAVTAPAGTINKINTPAVGWASFVSTTDAVPGLPLEDDAGLRARQATATALPSEGTLAGLLAALKNVTGVSRVAVYENYTGAVDSNGLAARSIACVVEGGSLSDIAGAIGLKKSPGVLLNGTTTQSWTDPITGIVYSIKFYVLAYTAINIALTVTAYAGWSSNIETEMASALTDYINGLGIGKPVQYSRLWAPAYLNGAADGVQYEITALTANGGGADIAIPFNKSARIGTVTVTVSP